MGAPLVSVICLCYNHSKFVVEALESVLNQSYQNIQLIVVDDASTDDSAEVIKKLVIKHPSIEFLPLTKNLGNCKAFNRGLAVAKGEYLIDVAADDILMTTRIEIGVKELQQAGPEYGVHFSDAEVISESGAKLGMHSDRFPNESIPQGDIYNELISQYFICPPTLMFTRDVMNDLGGYDETLTYEDFDFLIRSSRKFKYVFSSRALVKRRITDSAMTKSQFVIFSKHSRTTLQVCEKIKKLNRTESERKALSKRIGYEIKLNLRLLNLRIVVRYFFMWIKNLKAIG